MAVFCAVVVLILIPLAGANIAHDVEAPSFNGATTGLYCNATIAECTGEE
ncbi:hypothetical protein TIFTF001_056510, partial [Ficus carica]